MNLAPELATRHIELSLHTPSPNIADNHDVDVTCRGCCPAGYGAEDKGLHDLVADWRERTLERLLDAETLHRDPPEFRVERMTRIDAIPTLLTVSFHVYHARVAQRSQKCLRRASPPFRKLEEFR
nr:hypothetical protein [Trinickia symbiotica]